MAMSTDVLVVGGGIIGLAIAREAARAGLSVHLLERGQPGGEASGASAGMLAAQFEAESPGPLLSLCLASRALYADLLPAIQSESGVDPGLQQGGALLIARDPVAAERLERSYTFQRAAGLEVARLAREEVIDLEPALAASRWEIALRLPHDVSLDTTQLLRGLYLAALRAGAQVRTGAPAERLLVRNGRVVGAQAGSERFTAGAVVVAAGAWSGAVGGEGIPLLPTHPVRGQIVCLDPPAPIARHILMTGSCYLVPRRDGRILTGSTMERVGFDKRVTASGIATLSSAAIDLVPALAQASFHSAWAGLRPATADDRPAIGHGPLPGLLYACGHLRNGIVLAPITARIIVKLLRGEEPGMDLAPFSPLRFAPEGGGRPSVSGLPGPSSPAGPGNRS